MAKYIQISLLITLCNFSYAQTDNQLGITIESRAGIASSSYQPFWQAANRWGEIDEKSQAFVLAGASIFHSIHWKKHWNTSYGGQVYNTPTQQNWQMAQAYARVSYKNLQLSAGRYRQNWGNVDTLLSSGSMGISGNALPAPAVEISLKDYVNIPYTAGWLKVKGRWQHAWLGQDRFVKSAFLHAKNLYVYLGNDKIGFEGGLNHFAQWGGVHPNGALPNRFKDYERIVLGQSQIQDNTFTDAPLNYYNALGNHLLITDLNLHWKIKDYAFQVYTQTPYETGRNETGKGRDNLDGLYIFGKDRLAGIVIKQPGKKLINRLLFEYLYTKHQGGEGVFIGQFNYYNHSIYRSGWTHQQRIMGTPLFMSPTQAKLYFSPDTKLGNYQIISNRVVALHTGIAGMLGKKINHRNMLTYIKHYGNYYNVQAFPYARRQIYALSELDFQATARVSLSASAAIDFGSLSDNIGCSLGVKWKYTSTKKDSN